MNDKTGSGLHGGHALGAAAALYVPMAVLLAKGMAPVFALVALAVAVLEIIRRRGVPLARGPLTLALAAFAAWALMTWWWSITPDVTLKTGVSFAATLLGGVILVAAEGALDGRPREVFRNGLILGGAIGFALIAFEFASDAWLSRFLYGLAGKMLFVVEGRHTAALNAGLAATALFFWPWAMAVGTRFPGRASGLAIAAGFGLILLSDADAVGAGLLAGAAMFGVALAWPRRATWVMAAAVFVGVLTAPAIAHLLPDPLNPRVNVGWLSNSAQHRLLIWKNTLVHIKKHPVLGAGFDTARALYGPLDRIRYEFPTGRANKPWGTTFEPIPLHPHNGVLQVWLEMGAVGALILLAALLAIVRAIHAFVPGRAGRAAALAQMTTGLTIVSIGFGAWQSWWLTSILLSSAFMVGLLARPAGHAAAPPAVPPVPRPPPAEIGGPKGPEPTRYGDWERKGRAIDF